MSSMANSELLLQRMGASLVFIQPAKNGKPHGPSLMVELQSGTVGMAEHSMPLHEVGGQGLPEKILGIIGLAKLVSCSVLAVITHAEEVLPCLCVRFLYAISSNLPTPVMG